MAAELAKHESGAAAQVNRQIQSATNGQVATAPLGYLAQFQQLARFYLHRRVQPDGLPVQGRRADAAGDGDDGVLVKTQAGTDKGAFDASGSLAVAHQTVG